MKIITWNCGGAFRKKFHTLEKFDADILVVQECEDPSKIKGEYSDWAENYFWAGKNKNKGIGVFARTQINIKKLEWHDDGLQLFLPCRVNDNFNLIAVWTKQANSPTFKYIGQLWKYLQIHKNSLEKSPCIICGDLNSNVFWDKWDRWWNHSDVVRELEEIGIQSIYHKEFNEAQGAESQPTLFWRKNIEKPYHIDYAFASKKLLSKAPSLEVGIHEMWLEHSDHMPLVFTVNE